jgi:hypothetical protein
MPTCFALSMTELPGCRRRTTGEHRLTPLLPRPDGRGASGGYPLCCRPGSGARPQAAAAEQPSLELPLLPQAAGEKTLAQTRNAGPEPGVRRFARLTVDCDIGAGNVRRGARVGVILQPFCHFAYNW